METKTPRWTLASLAEILGGECFGPDDQPIARPVSADTPDPLGIAFAESDTYVTLAENSSVGVLIIGREERAPKKPHIRVDRPREAFLKLLMLCERKPHFEAGIHPTAVISAQATISPSASIGPYVVIEGDASIEVGAAIMPFCFIGPGCVIGRGTRLHPRVTLVQDVKLGANCTVHPGVVLGADGFGFVWDGARRVKVPQVGGVDIGDNVELGANTTVDRSTAGDTTIGNGSKLDNLIQVAHNCHIGEHTVIAAQSGIAGSSSIGDRCDVGGMTGLKDHIKVGNDIQLGGMSGLEKDLMEPGAYIGRPALPIMDGLRVLKAFAKLPDILSRLRALEKKVDKE
ncbi:MAG: UDP-3-O-(3-hydroxymyristoyl)glucosamine N-acyltransferase [Fimbriimonadaceae bacterium]